LDFGKQTAIIHESSMVSGLRERFYGSWNELVKDYPITYKELYSIVLSIKVWGSQLAKKCVVFHSDNMAVVYIINKQT
jgi:hypothetical protein